MVVLYEYSVTEHYHDGPPEPFGCTQLDHPPSVGETIDLYWLDGRYYRKAVVTYVNHDQLKLDVE